MARRVYFAFHYQCDISRVNVVRNSWLTHNDREAAGFFDASLWKGAKQTGDEAITKMIDQGLVNTSVTVFLLGTHTADRRWVRYELEQSYERGNGMFGIWIHGIKDFSGATSGPGKNIFDTFTVTDSNGYRRSLSTIYPVYDWTAQDGYRNLGAWVEQAAMQAGR